MKLLLNENSHVSCLMHWISLIYVQKLFVFVINVLRPGLPDLQDENSLSHKQELIQTYSDSLTIIFDLINDMPLCELFQVRKRGHVFFSSFQILQHDKNGAQYTSKVLGGR